MPIETDVGKRWEQGIPHHPRSVELFKTLCEIDELYGNNYFQWRKGGDGDNGEHLMYCLDVHNEIEDWIKLPTP